MLKPQPKTYVSRETFWRFVGIGGMDQCICIYVYPSLQIEWRLHGLYGDCGYGYRLIG
jgi:hypothetical protein